MALLPYVQDDTNSKAAQLLFEHCRSLLGRVFKCNSGGCPFTESCATSRGIYGFCSSHRGQWRSRDACQGARYS